MKQLNEWTDLELARMQGSMYQDLMRVQQNLIAINGEIEKRASSCAKSESVSE